MGTSEPQSTTSRFVVHRHRAGRTHFDLRLIVGPLLRSWSLLKEPPCNPGEQRLAVERESRPAEAIDLETFEEEAFGRGRVWTWDEGAVEIASAGPELLSLRFAGKKLSGAYELRRTRWYPGNRWLLKKARLAGGRHPGTVKLA
jgi:DNA ligase D-like protein (predicted 3'-phosphoesterase)